MDLASPTTRFADTTPLDQIPQEYRVVVHDDRTGRGVPPEGLPKLSKREAAKLETRRKVLTAARELFEAGGYHACTIRDIAQAIGMSTGAVFANFENKAAIWSAVFGGPPPSANLADEVARALGELPGYSGSFSWHNGMFSAAICGPDFDPVARTGKCWGGKGSSPAAAIRQAREAAVAEATHGVRPDTEAVAQAEAA